MKTCLVTAAIAGALLCACAGERPGPEMGWTAQNAVDKFCGRYEVESHGWVGPDADINGDGVIAPSHLEELLSGKWLGLQMAPFVRVEPAQEAEVPTQIDIHVFAGDYISGEESPENGMYSIVYIECFYRVSRDGTITFERPSPLEQLTHHQLADGVNCRLSNPELSMDGDLIVFSAYTDFYDFASGRKVSGRETYRFKCTSTKERAR